MPTNFTYRLSGCANGHLISIAGKGTMRDGRLLLTVVADAPPLDFDSAITVLACADALLGVAACVVAVPADEPLAFRCRTDFLTEGGAEMGTLVARGVIEHAGNGLAFRAQLVDARLAHEVGEALIAVPAHEIVLRGTCLFSDWRVETNRGREAFLVASTRLYDPPSSAPRVIAVAAAHVPRPAGPRLEFALDLNIRAQ